VHGTADSVVDIDQSRNVARVLRERGWDVTLTEVEGADHSSIVWAVQGSADGPVRETATRRFVTVR
jgi:predicted esterase